MKNKNLFSRFLSYLKMLFWGGLFTILPIIATLFIITFTYSFLAAWLAPLRKIEPLYLRNIPGSEFILVTLAILIIGFLVRLVFIMPIVHWFEGLITKIPIIRAIYSSSKTLVTFFSAADSGDHKRKVILIEFPRKGLFNIAFLLEPATNNFQKLIPQEKLRPNEIYYKVFMPNSPNPTSGYFFIVPESDIVQTSMTFDEAIKAIVSGGLVTPESLKY